MKSYTPNIGDLICYNSCGQRNISLGLVTNVHLKNLSGERDVLTASTYKGDTIVRYVQIYWARRPQIAPRSEYSDPRAIRQTGDWSNNRDKVEGWYPDKGCFEVIS